jgi:xylan 1,4-beta-xylosidase
MLDPETNFTRALGPSVNCFKHDSSHVWERWGGSNEFSDISWIEGPWVSRHNGTYYLQYSACGTEWRRYAVGVYTSSSPVGPWRYDDRSPLLKDRGGLIQGPGHHAVADGPGRSVWLMYHVLFRNTDKFDRRLALDPAGFDESGRMVMSGPSDTPQFVPGITDDPMHRNDTGWLALSIDKPVTASSSAPGRTPNYAVDNYVRTWWEAGNSARPQWVKIDLLGMFTVEACRTIFSTADMQNEGRSPIKYKIEASVDDQSYMVLVDKTGNSIERNIEYDPVPSTRAQYVRITVVDWPKGARPGIIEFTVFGTRAL